jgi:hypothetical protein
MHCERDDRPGFKFGKSGHCYTYTEGDDRSMKNAKRAAKKQGAAEHINHSTQNKSPQDPLNPIIPKPI